MRSNFNERAVNALYVSNQSAKIVLKELASMPRQDETNIESIEKRLIRNHEEITRRDIVTVFRKLDEYGAGEFIPGRRGHPSRFRWAVDSINVSTVDVSFSKNDGVPSGPPINLPVFAGESTVMIIHHYQLRKELLLSLQLPGDITSVEAHRLAQFIQSLPFSIDSSGGDNSGVR